MADDDVRALVDPLQVVRAARPRFRTIPEQVVTPEPTPDMPDPDPIVVPGRTELYIDPADLPPQLAPGGVVDMVALVAVAQAAIARWGDLQIRVVSGSTTLATTLTLQPASTREVDVAWRTAPLAPVLGAIPRLDVGLTAQGKVTARIKDGSVTDAGCTVLLSVVGLVPVVITSALPLTVNADAVYHYWPPYTPGA